MSVKEVAAIDVHGHYGDYSGSLNVMKNEMMSADPEYILKCAELASIKYTIVSPLIAFGLGEKGDSAEGNRVTSVLVESKERLFQWVVIHPDIPETFQQAEERIKNPRCAGIKIHPECHKYRIKDKGKRIFEFAAMHKATVISHSGEENSKPEDYVEFADEYPEVSFILAHLGCSWDEDPFHHIHAILKSKHGNIYTDTSSANSITPRLIEIAVREAGSDNILFGTDIPCYFSPMQRARIDNAFIDEEDKLKILYKNAVKLFENINFNL